MSESKEVKQTSRGEISLRRKFGKGVSWYNDKLNEISLPADSDVADMIDIWGQDCRYYSPSGKMMIEGKLSDHNLLHSLGNDVPGGPSLSSEKKVFEIGCVPKLGGRPNIASYIQNVGITTRANQYQFSKNWAGRKHRQVKDLCQNVLLGSVNVVYPRVEGKEEEEKSSSVDSSNFMLTATIDYEPGGYRLAPESLTDVENHQSSLYLLDLGKDGILKNKSLKRIELSVSGSIPDINCNIPHTYTVNMVPKATLTNNNYYLLCINSNLCLDTNCSNTNCSNTNCKGIQIMNPYYPPDVADSSEGFSSSWRSGAAGEIVYCFRFV